MIKATCINQLNKTKLVLYNPLLSIQQLVKQLCICNKTEHFSYNGGCGACIIRHIKEELTWALDKQLQVILKQLYQKGTKE